jgi:hypothetical protein
MQEQYEGTPSGELACGRQSGEMLIAQPCQGMVGWHGLAPHEWYVWKLAAEVEGQDYKYGVSGYHM